MSYRDTYEKLKSFLVPSKRSWESTAEAVAVLEGAAGYEEVMADGSGLDINEYLEKGASDAIALSEELESE